MSGTERPPPVLLGRAGALQLHVWPGEGPATAIFAFVGEAPVMKARLITCEAEGRFRTEDVFETVVPMLKNAPQREAFSF